MEKRRSNDNGKVWRGLGIALISALIFFAGVIFTTAISEPKTEMKADIKEVTIIAHANCNEIAGIKKDIIYIRESIQKKDAAMARASNIMTRVEKELKKKENR